MAKYEVHMTEEAIHKYANDNVYDALCQAVWNGVDALASEIRIDIMAEESGLEELKQARIESISVEDNGRGMKPKDIEGYLTRYNKSWKKGRVLDDGRAFHGRHGIGRFKYFALGRSICWETLSVEDGNEERRRISASFSHPKDFVVEDVPLKRDSAGTTLCIREVSEKAQGFLDKDTLICELMKRFALLIQTSADFGLYLNGEKLDPSNYIASEDKGVFEFEHDSHKYSFSYKFVAWKHGFEFNDHKHTFLFDPHLNYKGKKASGVQAGKSLPYHTVFLISDFYEKYDSFGSDFLDAFPQIRKIYRDDLLKFLYGVRRKRSGMIFKDFKERAFYPFDNPPVSSVEIAERDLFNVCAMSLLEHDGKVLTSKNSSLLIMFKLLRKLIEKSDDAADIVADVLDLRDEESAEFKSLLRSTSLPSLIAHYGEMQRRETFLDVLDTLVHDDFYKRHLKERSQLHKIVEKEVWIFGDEYDYQLGASDQRLTKVLEKHLKVNELTQADLLALEESIKSDSENLKTHLKKIPDLYLWRKYPDAKGVKVKNLVIELKAPKVDIGKAERSQADKIFSGIAQASGSGYTVGLDNQWEYYLISSKIKPSIDHLFQNKDGGILYQYENFTVYAKTWESIIRSARFKLEQTKKQLEMNISEEHKEDLLAKYLGEVGFDVALPEATGNVEA